MPSSPYTWSGKQVFKINGSGLHEDTLRIEGTRQKSEKMLRLTLPTLCITYADVTFQNAVGGLQENFPVSQAYGAAHFSPSVVINGKEDIERLTYIRGANRVQIGPRKTAIEWPAYRDLVVPRLRIDRKAVVDAQLEVPEIPIDVGRPLRYDVKQYADGRHIGGVRLEKRHPDWTPPEVKPEFDLWVRVIHGESLQALPEVPVNIWRWNESVRTVYGPGGFHLLDRRHTGGEGTVHLSSVPSGELVAVTIDLPGFRAVARCFRPLPGQRVRFHMRAWPLIPDSIRFTLRPGDRPNDLARRTGYSIAEILTRNRMKDPASLKTGTEILLPCWAATYRLEEWDKLEKVSTWFGYRDPAGLARALGLRSAKELNARFDLKLPDWRFFYAQEGDTLEALDDLFGLPRGSTITVGRAFHPNPLIPFGGETVAVPTARFAINLDRRR